MKFSIIFLLIFVISSESYGSDECFNLTKDVKSVEYLCHTLKNIKPYPNCEVLKSFDHTNVENLKYDCKINDELQMNMTIINSFTNLRVVNVSSLNFRSLKITSDPREVNPVTPTEISLDASHNNLQYISIVAENTIPNIIEMDLSFNRIILFNDGFFSKLEGLKKLNLRNNTISNLEEWLFKANTKLQYLDLRENQITTFSYNVFAGMAQISVQLPTSSITVLDVSCTKTPERDCPFGGFNDEDFFNIIETFNASGHQRNVLNWLTNLGSTLEELDFSHNNIAELNIETLREFPKLKKINFDHMHLTKLDFCAFHNQPMLEHLSLSHNELEDVDNAFESCKLNYLVKLDLTSNPLQNSQSIIDKFRDLNKNIDIFV